MAHQVDRDQQVPGQGKLAAGEGTRHRGLSSRGGFGPARGQCGDRTDDRVDVVTDAVEQGGSHRVELCEDVVA